MNPIFWLVRCKVCGSVFMEHRCVSEDGTCPCDSDMYTTGDCPIHDTTTYTQLAMFGEGESE